MKVQACGNLTAYFIMFSTPTLVAPLKLHLIQIFKNIDFVVHTSIFIVVYIERKTKLKRKVIDGKKRMK